MKPRNHRGFILTYVLFWAALGIILLASASGPSFRVAREVRMDLRARQGRLLDESIRSSSTATPAAPSLRRQ